MEAQAKPSQPPGSHGLASCAAVATAVLAASGAFHLLGFLVVGRRLAGAVDRPAPAAILAATAAMVGVFSWMSRRVWRKAVAPRHGAASLRGLDAFVGWGPSVVIVLFTLGLSLPLERSIDWLVWTPLWVADVFWLTSFFAGESLDDPYRLAGAGISASATLDGQVSFHQAAVASEDRAGDGVLLQQLSRHRDRDGHESISGLLRAEFAPGQRTAELYIGFCPPFETTPTIEVEQSGGPPARISTGQSLPHGARIDVRLNEPAAAAECVAVDFFAGG
jgi:hypothetical protein